ncbi:hypothetical protein NDU88_004603 [Pleurodeles waltl]|uniref:Uncharacterized protein n=1 Tax=Pleurodeles waltl TaxID=8319 RepID=A0AAV7LKH6_PLEWA|nr:hypothetical protein NDU88_004603 [Pleurodeles waltl]
MGPPTRVPSRPAAESEKQAPHSCEDRGWSPHLMLHNSCPHPRGAAAPSSALMVDAGWSRLNRCNILLVSVGSRAAEDASCSSSRRLSGAGGSERALALQARMTGRSAHGSGAASRPERGSSGRFRKRPPLRRSFRVRI